MIRGDTMQNWLDFYAVLQVHYSAEPDVIEAAYKRLCKKYHPDVNPSPSATQRMQQLNQAYETLHDAQRRKKYHQLWVEKTGTPSEHLSYQQADEPAQAAQPAAASAPVHRAEIVLEQYFEAVKDGRLRDAYRLLFREVRRKNPASSFIAWRQSVQQVFQITGFSIQHGNFEECMRIGDYICCPAQHFQVTIREKDLRTGLESSETVLQTVVQDGPQWGVYLKYKDLDQAAVTFRQAMGIKLKPMPDGLVDKADFYARADEQAELYRRRNQPLVLGQLIIEEHRRRALSPGVLEELTLLVGEIIGKNLRENALLSDLGEGHFALMMEQTHLDDAAAVLEPLEEQFNEMARTRLRQKILLKSRLAEYEKGTTSHVIAQLGRELRA